jgi:hypothetical protein
LKAILYEIAITESDLHFSHGIQTIINEIYIPTFKIFINFKGVWKYHKGRYENAKKIKVIDIPVMTAKVLSDSIKYKEESKKIINRLIKEAVKV